MSNVIKEQIGEGIEVLIEGLPQSVVTPSIQAKAALALVQHGIPLGSDLSAGVVGGILEAGLKIGGKYYKFKYSIIALKAITAVEVYSQAIQWIEFQMSYKAPPKKLRRLQPDYAAERRANGKTSAKKRGTPKKQRVAGPC